MDGIMEENIKSFSKGFVDNQSRIAELEEANKKLHEICDKYVPMALRLEDENKILKKNGQVLFFLEKRIDELLEENKRLKEDYDNYKKNVSEDMKEIVKEQTENIKLFDRINREYKKLEEEHRRLKEKYATCNLDSINKTFKVASLEADNKKLKETIRELSVTKYKGEPL